MEIPLEYILKEIFMLYKCLQIFEASFWGFKIQHLIYAKVDSEVRILSKEDMSIIVNG